MPAASAAAPVQRDGTEDPVAVGWLRAIFDTAFGMIMTLNCRATRSTAT